MKTEKLIQKHGCTNITYFYITLDVWYDQDREKCLKIINSLNIQQQKDYLKYLVDASSYIYDNKQPIINELVKVRNKRLVVNLLRPYIKDRTNCGYNKQDMQCEYYTKEKKKCVAGSVMVNPKKIASCLFDTNQTIRQLIEKYGQKTLFKKQYAGKFNTLQWGDIQSVHDNIANYGYKSIYTICAITRLDASFKVEFSDIFEKIYISGQKSLQK